jgi:hypothetical protein
MPQTGVGYQTMSQQSNMLPSNVQRDLDLQRMALQFAQAGPSGMAPQGAMPGGREDLIAQQAFATRQNPMAQAMMAYNQLQEQQRQSELGRAGLGIQQQAENRLGRESQYRQDPRRIMEGIIGSMVQGRAASGQPINAEFLQGIPVERIRSLTDALNPASGQGQSPFGSALASGGLVTPNLSALGAPAPTGAIAPLSPQERLHSMIQEIQTGGRNIVALVNAQARDPETFAGNLGQMVRQLPPTEQSRLANEAYFPARRLFSAHTPEENLASMFRNLPPDQLEQILGARPGRGIFQKGLDVMGWN